MVYYRLKIVEIRESMLLGLFTSVIDHCDGGIGFVVYFGQVLVKEHAEFADAADIFLVCHFQQK